MSIQKKFSTLQKENETLKDKNGIDLQQLTPRPNWQDLQEQYDMRVVDTEFQSTCLVAEKLMLRLSNKPMKKSVLGGK